jgi:hypothetical protein
VVDGSNLATEGRTLPSLTQLDEAVRAYADEDPGSSITVVVDASFEHRIDESERETVRQAMLNGELVSPPAGAIGRGDAFVLRIAERTGAVVLSNDSFQEFHGEHPWLFEEGRLIGGKPVPGVGWIFTPRLPIRGPKSRAATAEKRSRQDPASAPAKAAELAKAAKKAAKRTAKKAATKVESSWPITPTTPPPVRSKGDPALSSAIDDALAEAINPSRPAKAAKSAGKKKVSATKKAPVAKKAPVEKSAKASKKKAAAPKQSAAEKGRSTSKSAAATKKLPAKKHPAKKLQAELATAPLISKRRAVTPPPAVNEPLLFINFVAAFKVGSTVDGEVVSFTSHGAMVDVMLPEGGLLHCYIPLSAMGTPPPTKAREVLKKGEVRQFVLAGLDPPRRVAELALPVAPAKKRRAPAKKAAKASR